VSQKKDKTFVTHDAIRGQVTAVSATSISVKAADGVTQTYVVTADTVVRVKGGGKGSTGAIGKVQSGDRAVVLGTGSSTLTATHVLDAGK
jgi:2-C-methyl-D-erythritol 4-phosphate cytidylyltransferase